ncbi:MAG: diguanylate cyclase [Actinobacteria bacterium]|nr:diguanylate cyclase [Actinomycetota bacterium]
MIENNPNRGDLLVEVERPIWHREDSQSIAAPNVTKTFEGLSGFFEISPDLMCITDHEANFLTVNKAWTDVLGYSPDELKNHTYLDFVHPDDVQLTRDTVEELEHHKQQVDFINRYRKNNGSYLYVDWRSSSHNGNIYSVARDVTDRIEEQNKLNNDLNLKEKRLVLMQYEGIQVDELLHKALDLVVSTTASEVGFIFLYDKHKEEMVLHSWSEKVMDASCNVSQSKMSPSNEVALWGEVVRHQKPIIVNDSPVSHTSKKVLPQGHIQIDNLISLPIFSNGKIVAVVGAANRDTDYTQEDVLNLELLMNSVWNKVELIHKQEEILETLKFKQTILDTAPIGIVIFDNAGECVATNTAATQIIGKDPEILKSLNLHGNVIWKENGLYSLAQEALNSDHLVTGSIDASPYLGRESWMSCSFAAFKNSGKQHLLCMFQDDTKRLKAEKDLIKTNEKLETLIQGLERNKLDSDLLRQLSDMLQACHEIAEAYEVIEPFIPHLFPGSKGNLYMVEDNQHIISSTFSWGENPQSEPILSLDDCWALRRNQTHFVNTSHIGAKCQHTHPSFKGIYIDLPLIASNETIGMLHIEWADLFDLSDQTRGLAQDIADHIALSMVNIRLREQLQYQSIRDSLTGVFNRRYMDETLERELMRSKRSKKPLGVLMLDIDHFKVFNDTYGHAAGDFVLKSLCKLLMSHVRGSDIICRMGGEEFVVIMPDADIDVTAQRAEEIRIKVSSEDLIFEGTSLGRMTVSIGVASFLDYNLNQDELLRKADEAMYRAKEKGRNRVEIVI